MNLRWILIIFTAIFLCQCSKEGDEQDFEVGLLTSHPLIHDVDRPIGENTITANWFNISFNVTNNTNKYVKIEEVYFYYTVNGTESKITFDLGLLDKSDAEGNIYYYSYCKYISSGQSTQFSACRAGAKPLGCATSTDPICKQPDDSSGVAPYVEPLEMSIGGLSEQSGKSAIYAIRMELVGVFISDGIEVDRFNKKVYFTTQ